MPACFNEMLLPLVHDGFHIGQLAAGEYRHEDLRGSFSACHGVNEMEPATGKIYKHTRVRPCVLCA